MNEFNLLQFISPEIQLNRKIDLLLEECRKVIDWYHLLFIEEPFEPWKIYWHGLTSGLNFDSLKKLAIKHGMVDIKSRKMLSQREKMGRMLNDLINFSGDNYQLYTMLSSYDTESLLYMMASANSEKIKRLISRYFTKLKGTSIQLGGKDLKAMGFKPGPIYKKIFDRLLEARLNNRIKTKEEEVSFVENFLT